MEAREQTLSLLNTLWSKLEGLPNADSLELGAFFIILAFICESRPPGPLVGPSGPLWGLRCVDLSVSA